jgi:hypothetical protein
MEGENFQNEVEKIVGKLWESFQDKRKHEEAHRYHKKIEAEAIKQFELEILKTLTKEEKQRDPILRFIQEKIEKIYIANTNKLDRHNILTPEEIYPSFHTWFRKTYPRDFVISLNRMKDEMSRYGRLGPLKENVWVGIKIKK